MMVKRIITNTQSDNSINEMVDAIKTKTKLTKKPINKNSELYKK